MNKSRLLDINDTIYYDSFGRLVSFVIANIVEDGTDNPMYEDKNGNSVFQNDIVEQKLADKVKPKFHEGEWIVQGHNILKIRCVGDEYYCYETVKGYVDDMLVSEIDSLYHLWTIQDAKDGDVLATDDGNIFVFDGTVEEDKYPFAYCGLTRGRFESYDRRLPFTHDNVHPATKEQYDTLMKAMADARYTFDFEKKELKKIIDESK